MEVITYLGHKKFCANTYIVPTKNGEICIDPGDDSGDFEKFLDAKGFNIKAILLTHAHFDHIRDIVNLQKKYGCEIYINENDYESLFSSENNGSSFFNGNFTTFKKDSLKVTELSNDETINVCGYKINVIYTPFHTIGSVCYYFKEQKVLFSGDTLFKGDVGRTDLPTSMPGLLKSSMSKLEVLPDDVVVYPGHDEKTTIAQERKTNLYF